MVKNVLRFASILIYIFGVLGINAHDESRKTIQCHGLTMHEYSLGEGSSRGCLASCEYYFTIASRSNMQSLIYDRKNSYTLLGTRDSHFHPDFKINAAILDTNKLVTAQSYDEGLWVDTVDSNAPAQHTALPQFPAIKSNAYVEHLKSLPNYANELLVGIFAGRYMRADLEKQHVTQILPDTYVAQALSDNSGHGIWYRALEESGIELSNGTQHSNHRVGHYDMRSGKTTQLVLLPNAIKEISLNKNTDRCLLNMSNGTHYIYDIGTSYAGLIHINRSNFDSNHAFFVNDGTIIYFVKTPDTNNLTLTTYMVGIDDSHKSVTLSSSGNETAYLENSQLLVAYDGNSAEKVYEFSAE